MEIQKYSIFSKPNPDIFFDKKGLGEEGLGKLQNVVQSSKDTLSLADRLETARDNLKSSIALERDVNRLTRPFGIRFSLVDIRI